MNPIQTPADRYAELFVAVQQARVFPDSKTFVDCIPRTSPALILERYRRICHEPGFDLGTFVKQHFLQEESAATGYVSPPGQSLARHIDGLWDILTRHPSQHSPDSSLLSLPFDFVVPGGRFAELYYWDSYFTMLGLADSGRPRLLRSMLDNFAHLIDTYGYVPNGTRSYYLSRSQPPVFSLMVELVEQYAGCEAVHFLPQLLREHAFWMDGSGDLHAGQAHRRVVRLADGKVLNRYWDDRDTPREESWCEDVATAAAGQRPAAEVYRDLRAACESGWDFSSRWLNGHELHSICTTDLVPPDLNALMHKLESTIARLSLATGDHATANAFQRMARERQHAIDTACWCAERGAYFDFDWKRQSRRVQLNAATVVPLFVGTASDVQAGAVAATCRSSLLAPGGFATTLEASGEQWDRPNGWAPIQWMAVMGFERYGHQTLAKSIRSRWLRTVGEVYRSEAKVVEKYALRELPLQRTQGGGGGEYVLQDGFGWTNGVTRHWLQEKPARDVTAGGEEIGAQDDDPEPEVPLGSAPR